MKIGDMTDVELLNGYYRASENIDYVLPLVAEYAKNGDALSVTILANGIASALNYLHTYSEELTRRGIDYDYSLHDINSGVASVSPDDDRIPF